MELSIHSGAGLVVLAFMIFVMKWVVDNSSRFMRTSAPPISEPPVTSEPSADAAQEQFNAAMVKEVDLIPTTMCPTMEYDKTIKEYELHAQESLDEHLNLLTKKLAEKEGCLQLSKTKIRETQHEIQSLNAIDQDVKSKYRDIMETLKKDLSQNEQDCKKLQEQIEWVSMRRAELKEEVRQSQKIFGEAATDLASNLVELQRGRVLDKPQDDSPFDKYTDTAGGKLLFESLRNRKEPQLPEVSASDVTYQEAPQTYQEPQKISVHRIETVNDHP